MSLKDTLIKNPVFGRCPSCEQFNTLHRSRARSTKERLVKTIGLFRYYRCSKCGWRGSLSHLTIKRDTLKYIIIYLFLGFAAAFTVFFVLKRFY